jgi:hypothetical protein
MTEIQRIENAGTLAATQPTQHTAMSILAAAVQSGMSAESLTQLVALSERMAATQAEQAFTVAMAGFRAACPPVERRTENTQFQVTRQGVKQNRRYASLDDIAATIRKPLGEWGFSYRWSDAVVDAGKLTLSCVVSHAGGHSKSSSITLPTESRAGCSEAQKVGAVITYAQRYSLINALGLTSCDEDTDANEDPQAPPFITEAQAIEITDLLEHSGADRAKFLEWIGSPFIAQIPVAKFDTAMTALRRRIREAKK